MLNKSFATNLIAVLCILVGSLAPAFPGQFILSQTGLFALSGALTNWLAVYMLFEKIPLVYGSGVIPLRFDAFRRGIRALIFENFFSVENFQKTRPVSADAIQRLLRVATDRFDPDLIFDDIIAIVQRSSLGGLLSMISGDALETLREPFHRELRERLPQWVERFGLEDLIGEEFSHETLRPKIEALVDQKLAEFTPDQVKRIMDRMIRDHLSWLVVWGGVFGGLIGAISGVALNP